MASYVTTWTTTSSDLTAGTAGDWLALPHSWTGGTAITNHTCHLSATDCAADYKWTFATDADLWSGDPIPRATRGGWGSVHIWTPVEPAELRRQQKEADQKSGAARKRAHDLLFLHLSRAQRSQLKREGFFDLVAASGRRFRIRTGSAGNVYLLRGGVQAVRYCIHPEMPGVPEWDTMLAQLLMLQAHEEHFERVANKTVLAA